MTSHLNVAKKWTSNSITPGNFHAGAMSPGCYGVECGVVNECKVLKTLDKTFRCRIIRRKRLLGQSSGMCRINERHFGLPMKKAGKLNYVRRLVIILASIGLGCRPTMLPRPIDKEWYPETPREG